MRLKRVLVSGIMALAAIGFMPAAAQAVDCAPEVHDKFVGRNCWDCGWVMIRGQAYTLFHCD